MGMIIGLPDGGAGIRFTDHPAHHEKDGTITVTVAPSTLLAMVRIARKARQQDRLLAAYRDDEAEADEPFVETSHP